MSLALNLVERGEYSSIVGRTDGLVPASVPGRGLVGMKGSPVLEFQTAVPAEGSNEAERNLTIKELIRRMAEAWNGEPAHQVKTLPEIVPLSDLLPHRKEGLPSGLEGECSLVVPIGLTIGDLEPCKVDLSAGPNYIIAGPTQTGKTTCLQTWLLALAECCPPDGLHMYLVDSKRMGLSPLARLPHVKSYASEEEPADEMLEGLEQVLQERRDALDKKRRTSSQMVPGENLLAGLPALLLVIEDIFDPFDDILSDSAKDKIAALVQQGGRLGLHLLMSGSSGELKTNSWKEPFKTLKEAQTGLMLGIGDDSVFNLRLPYRERDQTLPPGEAYFTQRGKSYRIKLATAGEGELTLSAWVDLLVKRYAGCEGQDD